MEPQCPYYKPPKYAVDPKTGKGYEGAVWCNLSDHSCQLEYEGECEEYKDFLREENVL